MNNIYILEADPTNFGGIQDFVRNLYQYLPAETTFMLAYYGDISNRKAPGGPVVKLNERRSRSFWQKLFGSGKNAYLSQNSLLRNFALLRDIPIIRRNLSRLLADGGDTLVVNSASAILFFCSGKVLKSNRIVLVQHTAARMMRKRAFDFGGIFRNLKIALFRKYVDTFVLLSPQEEKEFRGWLPLENKKLAVIRHATYLPERVPDSFPPAVAMLCRLIPLKRIDRAVACAEMLPDIQFNIYGTGPEEKRLKARARSLPNVCFRGYTNDIGKVFQENFLLLITSEYEGYSISGIEACVHGRPIVALDTYPAVYDQVEDRSSGLVVTEFTPKELAEAICRIFAEPEKFRKGALAHRALYDPETARQAWRGLLLGEAQRGK